MNQMVNRKTLRAFLVLVLVLVVLVVVAASQYKKYVRSGVGLGDAILFHEAVLRRFFTVPAPVQSTATQCGATYAYGSELSWMLSSGISSSPSRIVSTRCMSRIVSGEMTYMIFFLMSTPRTRPTPIHSWPRCPYCADTDDASPTSMPLIARRRCPCETWPQWTTSICERGVCMRMSETVASADSTSKGKEYYC